MQAQSCTHNTPHSTLQTSMFHKRLDVLCLCMHRREEFCEYMYPACIHDLPHQKLGKHKRNKEPPEYYLRQTERSFGNIGSPSRVDRNAFMFPSFLMYIHSCRNRKVSISSCSSLGGLRVLEAVVWTSLQICMLHITVCQDLEHHRMSNTITAT